MLFTAHQTIGFFLSFHVCTCVCVCTWDSRIVEHVTRLNCVLIRLEICQHRRRFIDIVSVWVSVKMQVFLYYVVNSLCKCYGKKNCHATIIDRFNRSLSNNNNDLCTGCNIICLSLPVFDSRYIFSDAIEIITYNWWMSVSNLISGTCQNPFFCYLLSIWYNFNVL